MVIRVRGISVSVRPRKLLRYSSLLFIFLLVFAMFITVRLIPIQRAYAHPTQVFVSPASYVDTDLYPSTPGEPYHTSLYADGDGTYTNFTGNRGLRSNADGGYTDWTTACTIRPDGDGTYTDWNGTYQDWDDETPDGAASSVRASAHNWKESSSLASPVTAIGSISKVRVTIVARTTITPSENLTEMLVIGGTMYEGTSHALTTTYSTYTSEWSTNPSTTSAWAWGDITNLEAGVRSIQHGASWLGELRVTQLRVEVLTTTTSQDYMYWDDPLGHNGDDDYVSASGDAKHETSQLEDHTADDTYDIGKVRAVAYARANETTDEELVLTLGLPVSGPYDARPTTHATDITFDPDHLAADAYDGDNATYAGFDCGANNPGYLDVKSFDISGAPTTATISSVDFKMHYFQQGGGKCQYKISYKVDPSLTVTVLRDWTDAAHSPLSTEVWASQVEPNDGSWSWTDVSNIHFIVEVKVVGGGGTRPFHEHEAWVSVNHPPLTGRYEGESHSLTTTYQRYTSEWPWNPTNGSQWKWSHIDSLQAGVTTRQVDGSWTGEIRVSQLLLEVVAGTSLRPDGNGAFTDWTNDYTAWDEPSFHNGDTDHVDATAGGQKESSTLQDHTRSETWCIELVRMVVYARTTTDEKMAFMAYDPANGADTQSEQTAFALTTTYTKYTWEMKQNPVHSWFDLGGGQGFPLPGPWNWTAIDNIQAGVVSSAVTGQIRVTQLYIEVIGDTGNYKAWDESTHNADGDYLSAEVEGPIQTSNIDDSALTWGIASVKVTFVARNPEVDADPEKVCPLLLIGATLYKGAYVTPTTEYTSYTGEWGLNPATGLLWTWAQVNALEVGVGAWIGGDLAWTGEIRVTQLYVEVTGPGFTVDIEVDSFTNLWQYGFELFYNPDLIRGVWAEGDCPHRVGDHLTSAGGTPSENPGSGFNYTVGHLAFTGANLEEMTPAACPEGGGVLATLVFEVLRRGETDLILGEKTALWDYTGTKIIEGRAYVADGYFRNIDSAQIPVTGFKYTAVSPAPEPLEGYKVTFTDRSNATSPKTISVRRWYFWSRGFVRRVLATRVIESQSSVTRNFTVRGNYNVTLNVFDSDGVLGSKSDYLTIKAHDVYFADILTNYLLIKPDGNGAYTDWTDETLTVRPNGDGTYTDWIGETLTLRPDGDGTYTDWSTACTIRPDGDGTYTDWNGTYQDWDDATPDGDASSVRSMVHNRNESSDLASPVTAIGSISKVRVTIVARTTLTPGENLTEMLVIGGTMYEGTSHALTTTYSTYTSEWSTNPSTTSAWAWGDITNLEAGVRSIQQGGTWIGELRVTQLYVTVLTTTTNQDYMYWDDSLTNNGDADYVYATADAWNESSTLQDHTAEAWSIASVQVSILVRTNETTDEQVTLMLVIGGTQYLGDTYSLTTSYQEFTSEWTQNPATASAWTWSDIDALEAGVVSKQVTGTWTSKIMVTQLYVVVGARGTYTDWDDVISDGDATHVSAIAHDWKHSSTLQDHTAEAWSIASVQVSIVARTTWTTDEEVALMLVIGGTIYEGRSYELTRTYSIFTSVWAQNPATASAWTWSDIDALEAGVVSKQVTGTWTSRVMVTQLYVVVGAPGTYTDWDDHPTRPLPPPPPGHDGDSTYVSAATHDLNESSTLEDHTTETYGIGKVRVTIYAKTTITTDEQVTLMLVIGGTNYSGNSYSLTTSYQAFTSEWKRNPSNGSRWKWSHIDSLQAGVQSNEVGGAWTGEIRVTQLYVEVLPREDWLGGYDSVEIDEVMKVDVIAVNQGHFTETFDVSLFWYAYYEAQWYNGSIGTKQTVTNLPAGATKNVTFYWDTAGFSLTHPQRYTFHANASVVAFEYDKEITPTSLTDNEYTAGAPRIRFHDMAITDNPAAYPPPLDPYGETIDEGDPVEVTVTVTNQGDFNETNLTVKTWAEKQGVPPILINTTTYNLMTNHTFSDVYFASVYPYEDNYTATFSFTWDTTTFSGNYTIWSNVTLVPNDYETGDNTYTLGWRKVQPAVPEFPLGVALEIALAVVILYVWWKTKRKPNPKTLHF